jgi:NAD(P)-dependent dehydrogenase (short-subunit alcohol dehydrogenase family)
MALRGLLTVGAALASVAVFFTLDRHSMSFAAVQARHAAISFPNRLAVVVGGTSGLGQAIAERLAQADVSVIVVGRSQQRGEEVVARMKALSKSETVSHSFVPCDASLLSNVAEFAGTFRASGRTLDYLVLTQGIATIQGRTETSEGLDVKMSVHYYSRVAMAELLAPAMSGAEDPRVLSVLSAGVHAPYTGYASDPELKFNYKLSNAANAAGFYNDIAVEALSKEHANIAFIHAAPGFVATNWGTELPWYFRGPVRALQCLGRSPDMAGEYLCSALLDEEYKGGWSLMGQNAQKVTKTRLHDEARDTVWANTKNVLKRVLPGRA